MKKYIFVLSFLMFSIVQADVKDLICTAKVSDEILNLSWIKVPKKKKLNDNYEMVETDELDLENIDRFKRCESSEIAFQNSIRLDTSDIGKEDANVENTMIENCTSYGGSDMFAFWDHGKTKSYLMRTTPSYLLFSERDHFNNPFQVDRKTLEGFDHQKKVAFECVLNDVEEQENIL